MSASGNDPNYLTSVEVAIRLIRGNTGEVEHPMSAREERRLRARLVRRASKKSKGKDR